MPLFTSIVTVCTKVSAAVTFCAVAAYTGVPGYTNKAECTAYHKGRLEALLEYTEGSSVYSKATCHTANEGKMIVSALPGAFEEQGWLYTIKVQPYDN